MLISRVMIDFEFNCLQTKLLAASLTLVLVSLKIWVTEYYILRALFLSVKVF